jgi:hypothetical protein
MGAVLVQQQNGRDHGFGADAQFQGQPGDFDRPSTREEALDRLEAHGGAGGAA